ncbi:MAG: hypothetical protein PUE49_06385 [Eggerthellales bacterium]|nr:hypothetical protein [Eggerthellales bacterium]
MRKPTERERRLRYWRQFPEYYEYKGLKEGFVLSDDAPEDVKKSFLAWIEYTNGNREADVTF